MTNLKSIFFFALATFALSACGRGDDAIKSSVGSAKGADLTVAVSCAQNDAAALALDGRDMRHVPAESLRVVQGNVVRSLCDVVKESGKALAVVQFTSVTCFPCMQLVSTLNKSLADKGVASSVLSLVVVTDPLGMLSADDERRIKRDVASGATWVYDDFQDLWKFFSPGPAAGVVPAVTPLIVAIDGAMRGFANDDVSGDAGALVAKANEVLGTGL